MHFDSLWKNFYCTCKRKGCMVWNTILTGFFYYLQLHDWGDIDEIALLNMAMQSVHKTDRCCYTGDNAARLDLIRA